MAGIGWIASGVLHLCAEDGEVCRRRRRVDSGSDKPEGGGRVRD